MRLGIAHHLGWAVVVASVEYRVVDRRRIELLEPGLPNAPVHHAGGPWELHRTGPTLDDDALATLVATVRAAAVRATATALDDLTSSLSSPIRSVSLRAIASDFPTDVAVQRRVPYESRADSVMYRQVLAECARDRGWAVHPYDAHTVEGVAAALLGERAAEVLHGPRTALGPPWTKDHRIAMAATVLAELASPRTHP